VLVSRPCGVQNGLSGEKPNGQAPQKDASKTKVIRPKTLIPLRALRREGQDETAHLKKEIG